MLDRPAPAAVVIWQRGVRGADGADRLELPRQRGKGSACWDTQQRLRGDRRPGCTWCVGQAREVGESQVWT